MLTEKKYKILVWVTVILIILNISTLSSIYWHIHHAAPPFPLPQEQMTGRPGDGMRMQQYLIQKIGLNEDQADQFNQFHFEFRNQARQIADHMAQLRNEMLDEMMKDHPDEQRIEQLSQAIGDDHRDLKILTAHLFLNIKNICTPEQTQRLEKLFRVLMPTEAPEGPPGKMRHEQRRNWQHRHDMMRQKDTTETLFTK